jgi:hypothetical protein
MITKHRTLQAALVFALLIPLALCGDKVSAPSVAHADPPGASAEILADPNVLLSDRPTSDFTLDKRRLGDAAEATAKPFGELQSFPNRYGVTNGKITSMICPADVLKALDAEPTPAGLQMRLGKADQIEIERGEVSLYWYAKKRAAAVSEDGIKWFAIYK